jgi:hypothetical protein
MITEAPMLWQVREYDAARDADMVSGWWRAHDESEFPLGLLPPAGIIAEIGGKPVAACWLYMAVGVGVCWLEWPVSIPGLSLAESREAFTRLVEAMDMIAAAHDYRLMMAHTLPPIARVMKGMGFTAEKREKITVARRVNHGS